MSNRLISIDTSKTAGIQFPVEVRDEIAVLQRPDEAAEDFGDRQTNAVKTPLRHTWFRNLANTASPSVTEDTLQTVAYYNGASPFVVDTGMLTLNPSTAPAVLDVRGFDDSSLNTVKRVGGTFRIRNIGGTRTTYGGGVGVAIANRVYGDLNIVSYRMLVAQVTPSGWTMQKVSSATGSPVFSSIGAGSGSFGMALTDTTRVYRFDMFLDTVANTITLFLPDGSIQYFTDAVVGVYAGAHGFHEGFVANGSTDFVGGWTEAWSDTGSQYPPGEQLVSLQQLALTGTGFQPLDADLTSIAALTSAANKLPYATAASAWALTDLSAYGRTLIDDADATTARATLGVSIGSQVQAWDADLDAFALKTAPSGAVVGTTDNQTLTTKTINLANNTLTGTIAQFNTAASDGDFAVLDANNNLSADNFLAGFTTVVTAAGTTTLTVSSNYIQVFTGATTQTVTLPTTSVPAGQQFYIINLSSGAVTVQSSGANTIVILAGSTSALFTARVATPTTAANWDGRYWGDSIASGKTLTVSNSLTLAGTDATVMTFPTTSATIARTDALQTFTGVQTFSSAPSFGALPTGAGVSATATASTLAARDASAQLLANSFVEGFTSTPTAGGTTTMTISSTPIQVWTGATTQIVKLPTTSVAAGQKYLFINLSTGAVTVQSSGANTITILAAGTAALFTAVVATPTAAANWAGWYWGSIIASAKSLTVNNTLTLAGTDGTTFTFPTTSDTVVTLGAAQVLTGKTLTTPTIGDFTNATHNHTNAAGGGQLNPTTALTSTGTPSSATFLRGDNTWATPSGAGDVSGPASSVDNEIVLFNSTTGKLIKRASTTGIAKLASGVLSVVTAPSGAIVGDTDTQTLSGKSLTAPFIAYGFTTTPTAGGTTTMTITSTEIQIWTGSSTQIVKLPTTGVAAGQRYTIVNQSSAAVTVQSSGANTITILAAGTSANFTADIATPTAAADWVAQYLGVIITSGKSLSVSASLTLAGTDATTMTFPSTTATIARTDALQTFTGVQTFNAAPSFGALPTGAGVSATATASTLAARDASNQLLANAFIPGFTSTPTATGTTTMTIASTPIQIWTGSAIQTVKLPTTTVAAGQQYMIVNQSTGAVTVQSSGANTIVILAAGTSGLFTSLQATPTSNTHWDGRYYGEIVASGKSLTVNNTLTLAGTDATTMTFPATTGTVATLGLTAQRFTGSKVDPQTNTVGSSATPSINTDITDEFTITALAANITSMTTNLTGTPVNGQRLMIRCKDNGTARTITWGASFQSSGVATLLATTVISKTHYVGLVYNSTTATWVCLAVDATGF